jgi:hypothetical protein
VLLPIGKHFIHSQQNIKVQIDLAKYSSSQLSNYLSDVKSIDGKDLESLEALSEQFPYCQIIQSLIAKASISSSNFEGKIEKAAIGSTSRAVLFNLIHHPELFENKISEVVNQHQQENNNVAFADEVLSEEIVNHLQENNNVAFADEELSEEIVNHQQENKNVAFAEEDLSEEIVNQLQENNNVAFADEDHSEEIVNQLQENINVAFADENLSQERVSEEQPETDNQPIIIEEIDFKTETIDSEKPEIENYSTTPIADEPQIVTVDIPSIETYDHHDSVLIKEIEEEAISASIKINSEVSPQSAARNPLLEAHNSQHSAEPTLYNDNSLPFSFLWWLNKTRKEHYENNQPYKNSDVINRNRATDKEQVQSINQSLQLNHQIAESVLHLSVLDAYKIDDQDAQPVTKEDHIIKEFITKEPHIKPLAADKIDTENKAKKSSADSSELVSETLAKIYVEQMLYAKALDTYKKLSLKYPEKSTYFASQIKYLELKVN